MWPPSLRDFDFRTSTSVTSTSNNTSKYRGPQNRLTALPSPDGETRTNQINYHDTQQQLQYANSYGVIQVQGVGSLGVGPLSSPQAQAYGGTDNIQNLSLNQAQIQKNQNQMNHHHSSNSNLHIVTTVANSNSTTNFNLNMMSQQGSFGNPSMSQTSSQNPPPMSSPPPLISPLNLPGQQQLYTPRGINLIQQQLQSNGSTNFGTPQFPGPSPTQQAQDFNLDNTRKINTVTQPNLPTSNSIVTATAQTPRLSNSSSSSSSFYDGANLRTVGDSYSMEQTILPQNVQSYQRNSLNSTNNNMQLSDSKFNQNQNQIQIGTPRQHLVPSGSTQSLLNSNQKQYHQAQSDFINSNNVNQNLHFSSSKNQIQLETVTTSSAAIRHTSTEKINPPYNSSAMQVSDIQSLNPSARITPRGSLSYSRSAAIQNSMIHMANLEARTKNNHQNYSQNLNWNQQQQIQQQHQRGPPRDLKTTNVRISIYHLGQSNMIQSYNKLNPEKGIYHSGVVVFDREWCFGLVHDKTSTGMSYTDKEGHPNHTFFQSIDFGNVTISESELDKILRELKRDWLGCKYHVLNRNCHHFSETLLQILNPQWKLPE